MVTVVVDEPTKGLKFVTYGPGPMTVKNWGLKAGGPPLFETLIRHCPNGALAGTRAWM
jgi:hypothetical protein